MRLELEPIASFINRDDSFLCIMTKHISNDRAHMILTLSILAIVALVAIVAVATKFSGTGNPQPDGEAPVSLGLATGATRPGVLSQQNPECPDGDIIHTDGTRFCCVELEHGFRCTQLDVPEEGQACDLTDPDYTVWSNRFYSGDATCVSQGCDGNTAIEYESYRAETHTSLQCIDGSWAETGSCVVETRRSCVDDGPRIRCESELCGRTLEWWAQPKRVSDPEVTQSGDACSEAVVSRLRTKDIRAQLRSGDQLPTIVTTSRNRANQAIGACGLH